MDGVAHHCAKSSEVSAKPINAKIALPKQEAETVFASLFCGLLHRPGNLPALAGRFGTSALGVGTGYFSARPNSYAWRG